MGDLARINNFCDKIIKKDKDYPYSLKNLSGISDKTRDIMLEVIKNYQKEKSKQSSGYVESELISRFLNPSPFLSKKFKEIEGPVSLYQMSHPKYPQIFYLFGDFHKKISKCPGYDINQWLLDTIVNSPVFIDVYLESPYCYKYYPGYTHAQFSSESYHLDTYSVFEKCFRKQSKLECQTSRFHYADMRLIFETKEQQHGFLVICKNGLLVPKNVIDVNSYITFLLNKKSLIYKRIQKQFDNIKNSTIRTILEQSFKECRGKNREYIKHIQKVDSKLKVSDSINTEKITNYQICMIDYYLMGRCFRTYKKGSKYHRPSYNNIIYAGGNHVSNYVDILTNIGFVIDFKEVNFSIEMVDRDKIKHMGLDMYLSSISNLQCLNVSKLNQPMFHQRYR